MAIEYLRLHEDECYRRLDEKVVQGFQIHEIIRQEYSTNRKSTGGITQELLDRWCGMSKDWSENSLKMLHEVFVSEEEYWLFAKAQARPEIPDKTNITYWNTISLIDARVRQLAKFKEFVRDRFSVQLIYVAGDNIHQHGDRNSIKK